MIFASKAQDLRAAHALRAQPLQPLKDSQTIERLRPSTPNPRPRYAQPTRRSSSPISRITEASFRHAALKNEPGFRLRPRPNAAEASLLAGDHRHLSGSCRFGFVDAHLPGRTSRKNRYPTSDALPDRRRNPPTHPSATWPEVPPENLPCAM